MGGKGDRAEENRRIYGRQAGEDRETEPPFQGLPVPSCLLHCHTSTLDFPSCRPCLPFKTRGLGSKQKVQRVCGGAYLHRSSGQPHCLEASTLVFGPHSRKQIKA